MHVTFQDTAHLIPVPPEALPEAESYEQMVGGSSLQVSALDFLLSYRSMVLVTSICSMPSPTELQVQHR